ncbi:hypothetical protein K1W54_21500 [Micromonospora sp. CPCC 205371]|nr:hypothetical protein [Micromonospora sp. CPCC 205371]
MDYVNLQRATLSELTHEFRQLVLRQQEAWLTQWLQHARHHGAPVRAELNDLGFSILFKPDSFVWEFKVKIDGRDPLTFGLQHDAPWKCWDLNVRGELAILLASEGNGAAMQTNEFVQLSAQVKACLGAYIRHFDIKLPPGAETNFGEYFEP